MFDCSSLAAVATVVQEGSFERAARVLNVTPSAISQRIKLLEERLGAVLVVRGQPCTATDTGRLLCRQAGKLVELVPGKRLPVPLYWQHSRLQVPMLARLTKAVVRTAKATLG